MSNEPDTTPRLVPLSEVIFDSMDQEWITQDAAERLGIKVNERTWKYDYWKVAQEIFLVTRTTLEEEHNR